MRVVIVLILACVGAPKGWADDVPSDEQVAAWERAVGGDTAGESVREAARAGLSALQPTERALAVVQRLLGAAAPVARVEGARLAQRMGPLSAPLLPDLFEGMRDHNAAVRAAAAAALGAQGTEAEPDPEIVQALLRRLDDPQTPVRAAALAGLVHLGAHTREVVLERVLAPDGGSGLLVALLEDRVDRSGTVHVLLRSPSRGLRRGILTAMRLRLGSRTGPMPPQAWTTLAAERLREDPSGEVRLAAVDLLGRIASRGGELGAAVRPALRDPDPLVRARAYRVVDRQGLASREPILQLLREDLRSPDARLRACSAWCLRRAPADVPGLAAQLVERLRDDDPAAARSAAAALLERGHWNAELGGHLMACIAEAGVGQPYPEPARSDGQRGFDLWGGGGLPSFTPSARWNTGRLGSAGASALQLLQERLAAAPVEERLTWIHALGHVGEAGLRLLLQGRERLRGFERFVLDRMRVHAGERGEDLATSMLRAMRACDVEHDGDPDAIDSFYRRSLLASDALVEMGAVAVPGLVEHIRVLEADGHGALPNSYMEAERILRAIGKPALSAVRAAAQDPVTGHLFKDLREQLDR